MATSGSTTGSATSTPTPATSTPTTKTHAAPRRRAAGSSLTLPARRPRPPRAAAGADRGGELRQEAHPHDHCGGGAGAVQTLGRRGRPHRRGRGAGVHQPPAQPALAWLDAGGRGGGLVIAQLSTEPRRPAGERE